MMVSLFRSASKQIPSAEEGKVKFSDGPKITGKDSCTISLTMGWKTSASSKNVVVSDQLRADTEIAWPPCEKSSFSILVKGQGPAMQETRALRNSLPSPASRVVDPIDALHRPSGEHG